ncbi:DUF4806 domain-containing protein [Aphis craccivora]|uniref:DUF4806 domain-containing protein n=1 Tax=Aphis craccivora TaxID=307492 RepID=A0A6G0YEM8_APHCR|nr:DUF4806 domain-containing protein [Aphis craccivora]
MVAIVPNIWVQNCSNMYFCFWPPQKFQVTKMINSVVLPDEETWLQYPCEILKTFEEARSKLPKYDNNDDAESSNIENRGRCKRKKKPNTWKINSDSESDSYSPSMITVPEPPTWIRSLDDSYNRTNKLKHLTTPVFKKVTSIFTTPVPQEYNNDNSISENNLTQMNLLVQDQLPTGPNSDNCLSPPMFENDNESHNEENEQYQPSSSKAVDLSHATIHLLQQQILLVQQIVRGQQITNKLLTKLIMSNGESKPQSTIRQKCSEQISRLQQ